jgi:hypothetical protein
MSGELGEIATWLRRKAYKASQEAVARLESAKDRNATVAELKQARALAEKMAGHKLPHSSIDPEAHKAYCDMQVRIGRSLETEAKQLSDWADFLVHLLSEKATA